MSGRLKSAASARSVATRGTSAKTVRSVASKKSTVSKKDATATPDFIYQCAPCKVEGSILEATNYCMDCGENLCEQCVKTHKKFPAMKNHQILGKGARRAENDTVVTVNPLECPDHPGRVVDMYCGQHNEIWCGACIAVNHRNCASTRIIADAARGVQDSEEYKEMKLRIAASKNEVNELKKRASTKLSTLGKQMEKTATQIKSFRKRVNALLDQMEQESEQELEAEYGRCLMQLEHDLKVYNNVINCFDAYNSMLQLGKNDPPEKPSVIFVGIQRAKQKIRTVNEIVSLSKFTEADDYFQFFPDDRILTWLTSLKLLGVFEHQQRPYTCTAFQTYDVSHTSDRRSCDIYGSCLLDNGGILLTDWDNMKIKRLNEKYALTDLCEVPGNPAGICCINPSEAVVTLTLQSTLQFIKLEKAMTLSRKISVGDNCRGVTCNNGYIYVVCGGFKNENTGQVKVYTIAGSLVKVVETNNSKQRIFSSPIAIAVSSDGRFYHVTDGQRGIVTLTQRNDVVSVLSQKNITWPCGVALDTHENVLVCCSKSQSVLQKFSTFSLATILTYETGVRRPSSICFDRKHRKLIVTTNMANVIRVFQLEAGPLTELPPPPPEVKETPVQGKKKTRQTRVKASSVPLQKDPEIKGMSQTVNKPESSTKGLPNKKDAKPILSQRSKTEVTPRENRTLATKNEAKNPSAKNETQFETEVKSEVVKSPKTDATKPQIEIDEKTNYRKDPLKQQEKNGKGAKNNGEQINEAVSEIASDITKLLTSDNKEKTAADFKVTLQKIVDASATIKKSKENSNK